MLFIKYISDKYGDSSNFASPVTIPEGASFKDMIALTGKSDIGDKELRRGSLSERAQPEMTR